MSSPGPDTASAASEAQPSFQNDLHSSVDTPSSHDGHTRSPASQTHKRNESSSGSIYYDTPDIGQTSYNSSQEPAPTSQATTESRHGDAKLKGKEIQTAGSGEIEQAESSKNIGVDEPRNLAERVHVGGEINVSESVTAQLTRRDRVKQSLPGGNYHPRYHQEPGAQPSPNNDPDGFDLTSNAVTRPPSTRIPSFGAQGNTEEDRKNWERIQAIGGRPVPINFHLEQALPAATFGTLEPGRPSQKRKISSSDETRGLDGSGSNVLVAHPGQPRLSVGDGSSSSSYGNTPLISHTSPSHIRQHEDRQTGPEVIVPRWQPDAEVTLCPICGTQFSFFVRKHHCRKCGRVVCNACSPHRITIPYQFIVQPPTEGDTLTPPNSRARPLLDPARAGSSSEFENLGGGERVRLCNPCVPDPNIAPPQTPSPAFRNQTLNSPRSTHSRSSSSAAAIYSPSQSTLSSSNPSERPGAQYLSRRIRHQYTEQRSVLDHQPRNSPPGVQGQPYSFFHSHSSTGTNAPPDQSQRDPRIRATTVSTHGTVRPDNPSRASVPGMPAGLPTILPSPRDQADLRSLVPRNLSRPLPRPPRPQRIAEEDECPICHLELPSSRLPNSEDLRAAHITNCIENAMGSASAPSPPPQPATSSSFVSSTVRGSNAPSSSAAPPVPVPIANTPEARMAAREQAHAAVVLGQSSSPSPAFRRTGVFPYKATEKDCVDDAECTICLEEFEVGQDMGRLECFCRFHLHCIREWFVNHYGQCPVHHQAY